VKPMNFGTWLKETYNKNEDDLNYEQELNYGDEWGDYLYKLGYESTCKGLKKI
jgi:hypothetical protein